MNLWERTGAVGNTQDREFTGLRGDGLLDANGDADVGNWPGTNAAGFALGNLTESQVTDDLRVADRLFATFASADRLRVFGFRGVRSEAGQISIAWENRAGP